MNDKKYVQNIAYRLRKIGKNNFLIGENKCYELNEMSVLIWNKLDGKNSVYNISADICKEYRCDYKTAENDVYSALEQMKELNVVKCCE